MSGDGAVAKKKELIAQKEIDALRAEFTRLTGNKLGAEKGVLMESRLRKRLEETGLTAELYVNEVRNNVEESKKFISALTTHKTDWFREPQHYTFLRKQIAFSKIDGNQEPWMIWSAAASTGEEGYTTAFCFLEEEVQNFKILGTDISTDCIEKAKKGIYLKDVVDQQVRGEIKRKYFLSGVGESRSQYYKVDPNIQNHFKWREFNLMSSELPVGIEFNFIFLRNVLIYFDAEKVNHIVRRLLHYLKPKGFLIIGVSESIPHFEQFGLVRVDSSIYQKVK